MVFFHAFKVTDNAIYTEKIQSDMQLGSPKIMAYLQQSHQAKIVERPAENEIRAVESHR